MIITDILNGRNPLREVKIIILLISKLSNFTKSLPSRNPLREVKIIILQRWYFCKIWKLSNQVAILFARLRSLF